MGLTPTLSSAFPVEFAPLLGRAGARAALLGSNPCLSTARHCWQGKTPPMYLACQLRLIRILTVYIIDRLLRTSFFFGTRFEIESP